MKTFTEAQIKAIGSFNPQTFYESSVIYTLRMVAASLRTKEALTQVSISEQ